MAEKIEKSGEELKKGKWKPSTFESRTEAQARELLEASGLKVPSLAEDVKRGVAKVVRGKLPSALEAAAVRELEKYGTNPGTDETAGVKKEKSNPGKAGEIESLKEKKELANQSEGQAMPDLTSPEEWREFEKRLSTAEAPGEIKSAPPAEKPKEFARTIPAEKQIKEKSEGEPAKPVREEMLPQSLPVETEEGKEEQLTELTLPISELTGKATPEQVRIASEAALAKLRPEEKKVIIDEIVADLREQYREYYKALKEGGRDAQKFISVAKEDLNEIYQYYLTEAKKETGRLFSKLRAKADGSLRKGERLPKIKGEDFIELDRRYQKLYQAVKSREPTGELQEQLEEQKRKIIDIQTRSMMMKEINLAGIQEEAIKVADYSVPLPAEKLSPGQLSGEKTESAVGAGPTGKLKEFIEKEQKEMEIKQLLEPKKIEILEKFGKEFYNTLKENASWDGYDEKREEATLNIQTEVFLATVLKEAVKEDDQVEKIIGYLIEKIKQ